MKQYSNPSRKPMMAGGETKQKMMYGGKATPKKRQAGSQGMGERRARADARANADTQSRVATGRATAADKAAMQKQRREELMRMSVPELRKIAEGTSNEAMMAREVLRRKGDKGAMPPGDQQPAGKMYGGKAKK